MKNKPKTPSAQIMFVLTLISLVVFLPLTFYIISFDGVIIDNFLLTFAYGLSCVCIGTILLMLLVFRGEVFTTETERAQISREKDRILDMKDFAQKYWAEKVNMSLDQFVEEFNKQYNK